MPMIDDFNPNIHDREYWGESEEPMPDTCEGCRYWSELLARSGRGRHLVEAVCLSNDAPEGGQYTHRGCRHYEAGEPVVS